MVDDTKVIADLRVEKAPAGATPFIPEGDKKRVEIVLEPVPTQPSSFKPYLPPTSPYRPLPSITAETKSIILNIEATGPTPWDSRLICITIRDPDNPEGEPATFMHENEEAMVTAFIKWFEEQRIEELIGYNIAYDFRYIFAKCMRYQIRADLFTEANLYDLMTVMKQVKQEFVPGFNKPGTLDQWTRYLFGEGKLMSNREVLQAWGEGRVDDIVNFNEDLVEKVYRMWSLAQYVFAGHGPGIPEEDKTMVTSPAVADSGDTTTFGEEESTHGEESMARIECPNCLAYHDFAPGETEKTCHICGMVIKRE